MISTIHVHSDHANCLELVAVKGEATVIERLADQLIGLTGLGTANLRVHRRVKGFTNTEIWQ